MTISARLLGAVSLCTVLITGCAALGTPAPKANSAAVAATEHPSDAAAIDDYISAAMQRYCIPGLSVGVVSKGAQVLAKGYGIADLSHDVRVTADTVFELASVTKQFTAAAILTLSEDSLLELDDTVEMHLPGAAQAWHGLTIRQLLTHTSGLTHRWETASDDPWRLDYGKAELIRLADKHGGRMFEPGEDAQYSDQGYFVLGLIIEQLTGSGYGEYLERRLFAPAGMHDTRVIDRRKVVAHFARAYEGATSDDGGCILVRSRWREIAEAVPAHYGVISTVRDMAKWHEVLSGSDLLSAESIAAMTTPATMGAADDQAFAKPDGEKCYGLGWYLGRWEGKRFADHHGVTGTYYLRFPDDELSLTMLTNNGHEDMTLSRLRFLACGIVQRYREDLIELPSDAGEAQRVCADFGRASCDD